jgi:hypothetical protein
LALSGRLRAFLYIFCGNVFSPDFSPAICYDNQIIPPFQGHPLLVDLEVEYTPASDSRRENPGLTGSSPSRDEVGEKAGLDVSKVIRCLEIASSTAVKNLVARAVNRAI